MNFTGVKDEILYIRLKGKDREAFIKAYDLYVDDIYRFVFFKLNNREEAEDITSQVFLKSWDYIQNNAIKDFKTLKSLFYKVARNLVIDHYRKKNNQQAIIKENDISEADIIDLKSDLAGEQEAKSDYELIESKMLELKDEYRVAIILAYINELSISEIARIMNKSKGNTRVLIYRALNALKELVIGDLKNKLSHKKERF